MSVAVTDISVWATVVPIGFWAVGLALGVIGWKLWTEDRALSGLAIAGAVVAVLLVV